VQSQHSEQRDRQSQMTTTIVLTSALNRMVILLMQTNVINIMLVMMGKRKIITADC
jgi:hypothetical protein